VVAPDASRRRAHQAGKKFLPTSFVFYLSLISSAHH
jgi:hypothetical protein